MFPAAMIEAARKYITYLKLKCILNENADELEISRELNIIFTPQILMDTSESIIELYKITVKAFFSYPNAHINNCFINNSENIDFIREINKNNLDLLNKIKKILGESKLAFNAIKSNIPLAFYNNEIFSLEDIIEDNDNSERNERENSGIIGIKNQFIDFILKNSQSRVIDQNGSIIIKRPELNSGVISNILFGFSLYIAIQKFKRSLSKMAKISEIRDRFIRIYRLSNIGLLSNVYFLERDLDNIERLIKAREIETEYILLQNLVESGGSSDIKRNFLAHSGFVYDYTMVKKEKTNQNREEICVKWDENKLNRIKRWLNSIN